MGRDLNHSFVSMVATIDVTASSGRTGLSVGDRAQRLGDRSVRWRSGHHRKDHRRRDPARLSGAEAGHTRQVRTIDLEPIAREA